MCVHQLFSVSHVQRAGRRGVASRERSSGSSGDITVTKDYVNSLSRSQTCGNASESIERYLDWSRDKLIPPLQLMSIYSISEVK